MSAGTCRRCCGDGWVLGRWRDRVGFYTVVCTRCKGTGNYPPTLGPLATLRRWLRRWLGIKSPSRSGLLDDALDKLGAL